jgi:hypothetical protein
MNCEEKEKLKKRLRMYYDYKNSISVILNRKKILDEQLKQIDEEIEATKYMRNTDKEFKLLKEEREMLFRKSLKCNRKVREMQRFIKTMDDNIQGLTEECLTYLDLKFNKGKSNVAITLEMNLSETSRFNMEAKALESIYYYDCLQKGTI